MTLLQDLINSAEEATVKEIADRLDLNGFVFVSDFVRAQVEPGALARVIKTAVEKTLASSNFLLNTLLDGNRLLAEMAEQDSLKLIQARAIMKEFVDPSSCATYTGAVTKARNFLEGK